MFQIVLPDEPKPWEKTAAEELKHYLGLCLGGNRLTVEGLDGVVFHVGDTAFARENLRRRVKDNAPYHGRADCPQSAAECEKWYAKYPILRRYDEAFRKMVREMRDTKVEGDTPAVWYVYNMGVVVKTRKSLFSIDLCHRLVPTQSSVPTTLRRTTC